VSVSTKIPRLRGPLGRLTLPECVGIALPPVEFGQPRPPSMFVNNGPPSGPLVTNIPADHPLEPEDPVCRGCRALRNHRIRVLPDDRRVNREPPTTLTPSRNPKSPVIGVRALAADQTFTRFFPTSIDLGSVIEASPAFSVFAEPALPLITAGDMGSTMVNSAHALSVVLLAASIAPTRVPYSTDACAYSGLQEPDS